MYFNTASSCFIIKIYRHKLVTLMKLREFNLRNLISNEM